MAVLQIFIVRILIVIIPSYEFILLDGGGLCAIRNGGCDTTTTCTNKAYGSGVTCGNCPSGYSNDDTGVCRGTQCKTYWGISETWLTFSFFFLKLTLYLLHSMYVEVGNLASSNNSFSLLLRHNLEGQEEVQTILHPISSHHINSIPYMLRMPKLDPIMVQLQCITITHHWSCAG